jgi:hypothetical protein
MNDTVILLTHPYQNQGMNVKDSYYGFDIIMIPICVVRTSGNVTCEMNEYNWNPIS